MQLRLGILIFLIVFYAAGTGHANIAMPRQSPAPAGGVGGAGSVMQSLRIKEEKLILDLTKRPNGRSRASYRIDNPTAEGVKATLYFITPFMNDVFIAVDGRKIDTGTVTFRRDEAPWKINENAFSWWGKNIAFSAVKFDAFFRPRAITEIQITFRLPAGYDNTKADIGIDPGTAAHSLNWSKPSSGVSWYAYSLESASTFRGEIDSFQLEVLTMPEDELQINVELNTATTGQVPGGVEGGGIVSHSGSFDAFPVPTIEAWVTAKASYNMVGGSFALGLVTDYGMYTEFMTQVLLDFYIGNHQISCGLEGNPLGAPISCKIPILYTFIFGEKMHPSAGWIGDSRLSGGLLWDILPETVVGIRFGVGMRFTNMILEITYDMYPFDTNRGYVGRMTFLYKISI
jgi:hypothetical protein